jgi:hypothetical protein
VWRLINHLLVLLLLIAVGGGAALCWLWFRSDEFLRAELLRQADTNLTNATVTIERAQFDLLGRVRIYDLAVHLPGESQPALLIPETIITLDRQRFAEKQQIVLQNVRVNQPHLRVVRDAGGAWAWRQVRWTAQDTGAALPDIDVAHGQIELILAATGQSPAVTLPLDGLQIAARPASRRAYALEVSGRTEITGPLRVQGQLPLEPAAWNVKGEIEQLRVDPATVQFATILEPKLVPQLDELHRQLAQRLTALGQQATAPKSRFDLGLSAVTRIGWQASQPSPDDPATFKLLGEVKSGHCTHPALPFPLTQLQGKLYVDGTQVILQGLQAAHGDQRVKLDAKREANGRIVGSLTAEQVPLDEALVKRLPATLRRHVATLALTGLVSGKLKFSSTDGQAWTVDGDASLTEGTIRHEKFPVLAQDVTATGSWRNNTVELKGKGRVGVTPVSAEGTIHNPGPAGDATFFVKADDFLLDDEILRACPTPLRKTITALKLTGRGDGRLRVVRPAGLNQKYQTIVDVRAREASIQYEYFPYAVTNLTGLVHWEGDAVTFEKLSGRHEGAVLNGSGSYTGLSGPGLLKLDVTTQNAEFDRALYAALPKSLRDVWDGLSPQGQFSVRTDIQWTPGTEVQVVVPQMTVHRGEATLYGFPFPWHEVEAELAYENGQVDIKEFSARHDELRIRGQGLALCPTNRPWQVTLSEFLANDITFTAELRRALPVTLKQVVDTLAPQGRFSATGPVSFFGPSTPSGSIGATWDLDVHLAGCSLNAGLLLTNVHGHAQLAGQFNGVDVRLNGDLKFDSLFVLENHLITQVRGPLKYRDMQLEVGSKAMAASPVASDAAYVSPSQRITGQTYDGEVTLDAFLDLRSEPDYRAHLELTNASLEQYARRHMTGEHNVRGLMNGWMDVRGRGLEFERIGGEGQLQISPAALYELPVFLQIFQLPQFQPINRAAFNYANFFFTLGNGRFDFQAIDLVGNAISLRGRGWVRYDGFVNLDFFTMQPRNGVRVPGLRELVGLVNLVGQGWIAVEVRGPMDAPSANVVPFPAVDNAMKQFLGVLEARPAGPPPLQWRGPPRASDANTAPRR